MSERPRFEIEIQKKATGRFGYRVTDRQMQAKTPLFKDGFSTRQKAEEAAKERCREQVADYHRFDYDPGDDDG